MFTYRRPNEISSTAGESFLADGPTNEILEVYVSEMSTQTFGKVISPSEKLSSDSSCLTSAPATPQSSWARLLFIEQISSLRYKQ